MKKMSAKIMSSCRAVWIVAVCSMLVPMFASAATLTHRWSFNGDYSDSVGGCDASLLGDKVKIENGMAVMYSTGDESGALNLGANVFGTADATVEIWGRRDAIRNWARVFDYGKGTDEYVMMSWCAGTDANNDQINIKGTDLSVWTSMSPYENNVLYHLSMTFKVNETGSTTVKWARRNVGTGAVEKSGEGTAAGWTLASLEDPVFYLGHSLYHHLGDQDANASYDEVRIYSGVVSDDQLSANAKNGPNAYASVIDAGVTIAEGVTFTVTNSLVVNGTMTLKAGAKIKFDTANFAGEQMTLQATGFELPGGGGNILEMVELTDSASFVATLNGNTIVVASTAGSGSHVWTGDAEDGDISNPQNWEGGVPDYITQNGDNVSIEGFFVNLQIPKDSEFTCSTFTISNCTLIADCDWSGLGVTPVLAGTVNLNGYDLTLTNLTVGTGKFINNAEDVSSVRFPASALKGKEFNEANVFAGFKTLNVGEGVRLDFVVGTDEEPSFIMIGNRSGVTSSYTHTNGTLKVEPNGGSFSLAPVEGSKGIFNLEGGAVEIGGFASGRGNAGYAEVNITNGELKTTWIDLGNTPRATAVINQSGGTFTADGNVWIGRENSGVGIFNLSGGTFTETSGEMSVGRQDNTIGHVNQTGGELILSDGIPLYIGAYDKARGFYNISGGNLVVSNFLWVGAEGFAKGVLEQSGGTIRVETGLDLSFAVKEYTAGVGTQTGGTIESPYAHIYIGSNGRGVFNLGGQVKMGDGKGLVVGNGATGRGELRLGNGGALETAFIRPVNADSQSGVALGQGTITAKQSEDLFIANHEALVFDPGTNTINVGTYNVGISDCTETMAAAGSVLRKIGSGTLTIDKLPPVEKLSVEAGTVAVSADNTLSRGEVSTVAGSNVFPANAPSSLKANNYLLHRWDFNGQVLDLVGTNHGAINGTTNIVYSDNSSLVLPGGSRGTAWVDCGSNLIPSELGDIPFTIEAWVTPTNLYDWAQVFALGNSSDPEGTPGMIKGIIFSYNGGGGGPMFRAVGAKKSDNIGVGSNLTLDKEYHIAIVVKPKGGQTATLTAYIEDPSGEEDLRTGTVDVTDWSTETIVQDNFWLGHSHWPNNDPAAKYNEVRIWGAALSEAQFLANGTLGANTLPVLTDDSMLGQIGEINVAEGAALDLGGKTLSLERTSFTGSGTIRNGTLAVTDTLFVKVGECITVAGLEPVDLTGVKVTVVDPENLDESFSFIKTADGSITGTPIATNLPGSYSLRISGSTARIVKSGFTINLR